MRQWEGKCVWMDSCINHTQKAAAGRPAAARQRRRTLEALADGLDGAPAALLGLGQAGQRVVNVAGDVHLQQQRKLGDDVLRRAALLLLAQPVVGLDDLAQLVRQVVLGPVRV